MIKAYRRRFVAANMALVGAVLLVVFAVLVVLSVRTARNELQNTMQLMMEPWDAPGDRFQTLSPLPPDGAWGDGERPGEGFPGGEFPAGEWSQGERPDLPPNFGQELVDNGEIVTLFYSTASGEISVLSREEVLDSGGMTAAVEAALAREDSFGHLKSLGLFYYKEGTGDTYKIALARTDYVSSRVWKNVLLMAAAFLVAVGLFLLISIRLSRVAARPMEEAIAMERQFVADLSHDLKTPITVVLANNSILRASPEATVAEQRQWIDSTEDAAKNMMGLVGEMLTLSSLESPERKVDPVPVSLSAAAEKSALQLESLGYERGVTLETDIAPGITVSATPEYAERICGGLIENALKYEPAGGTVYATLTRQRKKAVFSVRNPGSVVDPEDLPHLFERFYRGDKARTAQGHGLGLSIIRQITELLGAEIHVTSTKEAGTEFTVTFDTIEK